MAEQRLVQAGSRVQCRDAELGVVEEALVVPESGALARLLVRSGPDLLMVPADLIVDASEPGYVRLKGTRQDVLRKVGVVSGREGHTTQRIPILEERLRVTTELLDLGELRVHKRVEREPAIQQHTVERDELDIERVRLDQLIDAPVKPREEDGWLIVPIMEEVLVVTKQLVLTEEVRIRTRRVTEEQEVYEELRKERVDLEDATVHGLRLPDAATMTGRTTVEEPARDHGRSGRRRKPLAQARPRRDTRG